ncbi:ABC transporter substrate-binding protein [Streptomyces fuscichromogenes]|uniref:Peptide ABC transporter substrate-binding protein n=1 Tax=Streptomyces fuscichromogenes TaxID=1324013 RepID=A0A917UI36_9ACTN|nr:ABC transporter substrate-binding protein [Streptomyces fuscichromogenes]GGM97280.1 peptide ABC transporter substrate-binding protein [Streptomyces fuscichromogenes]
MRYRGFTTMACAGLLLTACTSQATSGPGGTGYVTDGTATIAVDADPGALNPLTNSTAAGTAIGSLAYDHLVSRTLGDKGYSGELARSWKVTTTKATFVLRKGVTCADGSTVTPSVVAKTFDWVLDTRNASPWLGAYIPADAKVTADDAAGTLTVSSPTPGSFLLENLSYMPILCGAGADNPAKLTTKTSGSGMYQLTSADAGQTYTFTVRRNYTWGADGVTAKDKGVPAKVVVEVVPNESTRANLLTAGDVNLATVGGADRDRLDRGSFTKATVRTDPALLFYNHAVGRAGADPAVRTALAQALDLKALGSVATGGRGTELKSIVTGEPAVCSYDAITGNLPAGTLKTAAAALDAAGWKKGGDGIRSKNGKKLALTVLYPSNRGADLVSAVELLQTQWTKLGVKVRLTGSDSYATTLFTGGDWDVVWAPFSTEDPSVWTILANGQAPPRGRNFASIDNKDYQQQIARAQKVAGAASCTDWKAAEAALVRNADLTPIEANSKTVYGSHVTFRVGQLGAVKGSTIRLTK